MESFCSITKKWSLYSSHEQGEDIFLVEMKDLMMFKSQKTTVINQNNSDRSGMSVYRLLN